MNIEIIAVGTELLTPRFQDTNSAFLTGRLADLGLPVSRRTIVGDRLEDLGRTLRSALAASDLILIGGGLGPTGDDLTRESVAEVLGRPLIFHEDIMSGLAERFARRGRTMALSNRKQAMLIEGAEILENRRGTAPGQWIESGRARIVLLPGPPRELEGVFDEQVRPRLERWRRGFAAHRILRTTGLTESEVEDRISGLYPAEDDLVLTVLAAPGRIDLRIAAFSEDDAERASSRAADLADRLRERLGDRIYGETEAPLEDVVGRLLGQSGATVAVAESCTGGLLADRLTDVPGSSAYFLAGFVAYSNSAKTRDLGVPAELIEANGAVSAAVAEAMARGAAGRAGARWGIGISGIAGPTGGTADKPVGLVFVALAGPDGTKTARNVFFGRRDQVKFHSTQAALDMLRRALLGLA